MNDERDGIDTLRRAIDELAERLPAGSPRRRLQGASQVVVAVVVIAAAAIAVYRLVPRAVLAPAVPSAPAALEVEVKFLRVHGREVAARVFDAARAGTVVVAPATGGSAVARPMGAVVILQGGPQ
jgi:hypothetical protein